MDVVLLAATHQLSVVVADACSTWTTSSGAEIMADVISGFLTLGFGVFIYRLPPEK